jgi:cellulose synthase/poly-beta-1,6-N-acetylglucosamine synthase-like glycosyltransferase
MIIKKDFFTDEKFNPEKNPQILTIPGLSERPTITIVMPVRNEEQYIEETLKDLMKHQYTLGDFEILVVDGNSTNRTVAIVRRKNWPLPIPVRFISRMH